MNDAKVRHRRYDLHSLGPKDVGAIADPRVREVVERQLAALEQADPRIAFKGGINLPTMRHGDGRDVVIRKARIRLTKSLDAVGKGGATRYVAPGSNHHMAVVDVMDSNGKVIGRELEVVTLLDAFRRKQRGEPVVQTDWGAGRRLAFTLRSGDSVEIDDDGKRLITVVSGVSDGRVELVLANDARMSGERKKAGKAGGRLQLTTRQLFECRATKVVVQPLGEVCISND